MTSIFLLAIGLKANVVYIYIDITCQWHAPAKVTLFYQQSDNDHKDGYYLAVTGVIILSHSCLSHSQ